MIVSSHHSSTLCSSRFVPTKKAISKIFCSRESSHKFASVPVLIGILMGAARTRYVTRYVANILNSHPWRFRRVTHNTRTVPPGRDLSGQLWESGIRGAPRETLFIRDREWPMLNAHVRRSNQRRSLFGARAFRQWLHSFLEVSIDCESTPAFFSIRCFHPFRLLLFFRGELVECRSKYRQPEVALTLNQLPETRKAIFRIFRFYFSFDLVFNLIFIFIVVFNLVF